MRDDRIPHDTGREPGLQPDPMLTEGRATPARKWAVTGVIVVALLAVMYGLTAHRVDVQDAQRQSQVQRDASPTSATQPGATKSEALPGGRGMSSAPPAPPVTKPGG